MMFERISEKKCTFSYFFRQRDYYFLNYYYYWSHEKGYKMGSSQFPINPEQRQLWVRFIEDNGISLSNVATLFMCSRDFNPDQNYTRNVQQQRLLLLK